MRLLLPARSKPEELWSMLWSYMYTAVVRLQLYFSASVGDLAPRSIVKLRFRQR
jgi:hypothetical protein